MGEGLGQFVDLRGGGGGLGKKEGLVFWGEADTPMHTMDVCGSSEYAAEVVWVLQFATKQNASAILLALCQKISPHHL